jgi:FtsP/CotA-like multicopper oxidase with cupredoxin domain
MKIKNCSILIISFVFLLMGVQSYAHVFVQCPGDNDGDAMWMTPGEIQPPNTTCIHLAAGDGYSKMADGKPLYIFSFSDVTGMMPEHVMMHSMLAANFPAPSIIVDEGQNVYLTLTNVGMVLRPDLFDPHSVHWHGFPNASIIFDGEPMGSISINMGASLTYYYVAPDPGTYMYHCHVEATEHMQMGMLGNLYVRPKQNQGNPGLGIPDGKYVYNDGVSPANPGSTKYDREFFIQINAFDSNFHELHINVQPLPFANMWDDYGMLNGRGYPDTVRPNHSVATPFDVPVDGNGDPLNNGEPSQRLGSLIKANVGDKVLLRISSLSTVDYYTLTSLGIPIKVVGKDARILWGSPGNQFYTTNSVTLGGGQSFDVILDTAGIPAGTYFLYTTNLNFLSNGTEDFGGMMTEIEINPAGTLSPQTEPNT